MNFIPCYVLARYSKDKNMKRIGNKIYRKNSSGHLTVYVIDKVRPPYVCSGSHRFKLDGDKAIPARDTELSLTKDEFLLETDELKEAHDKQQLSISLRARLITMTDDQWNMLDKEQLLGIKRVLGC